MDFKISNILHVIGTLHKAEQEADSKKFFLSRWKIKKEINSMREDIRKMIDELFNDIWTIPYIKMLESAIILHYNSIKNIKGILIPDYNPYVSAYEKFIPMYFSQDKEYTSRTIIIDIISDNINITIFDGATGKSIIVSTEHSIQPSQKKIEDVCKRVLIKFLNDYLDQKY